MKWLFGRKLITKEEYHNLKDMQRQMEHWRSIALDSEIAKEQKEHEKKYAKYIGKWFEDRAGYVFQIKGVRYNSNYSWRSTWVFNVEYPNMEEWADIEFEEIEKGNCPELTLKDVRERLGV